MTSLALTKSTVAVGSLVLAGLLTAAGIGIHQASAQSGAEAAGQGSVREIATELTVPLVAVPSDEVVEVAAQPKTSEAAPARTYLAADTAMPPVDLKERSPSEKKIEATLTNPRGVAVEFIDQPLREVIDFIGATYDIPIIIEEQALTEEDVSVDEPINRVVTGALPLESALNIILDPLGLTYVIEDDVMKITTLTEAREKRDTRIYPVRDLIDSRISEESLQRIIKEHAKATEDGEPVIEPLDGFLAIRQSLRGHRETAKLLEQLRRAAEMRRKWNDERSGQR